MCSKTKRCCWQAGREAAICEEDSAGTSSEDDEEGMEGDDEALYPPGRVLHTATIMTQTLGTGTPITLSATPAQYQVSCRQQHFAYSWILSYLHMPPPAAPFQVRTGRAGLSMSMTMQSNAVWATLQSISSLGLLGYASTGANKLVRLIGCSARHQESVQWRYSRSHADDVKSYEGET